jgi:hypothetical protein
LIAGERFFCFVAAQKDVNRFEVLPEQAPKPAFVRALTLTASLWTKSLRATSPKRGVRVRCQKRQKFRLTA